VRGILENFNSRRSFKINFRKALLSYGSTLQIDVCIVGAWQKRETVFKNLKIKATSSRHLNHAF
jgi:hypothetical protein